MAAQQIDLQVELAADAADPVGGRRLTGGIGHLQPQRGVGRQRLQREQLAAQRGIGRRQQLAHRPLLHNHAVADLGHRVGGVAHRIHLVGDQDDRQAIPIAQLFKQAENGPGGVRIQPGGGLIRQQHRRIQRQRAGDADPLALAAGQLSRVKRRLVRQPYRCQQALYPLVDIARHHAQIGQRQRHILPGGFTLQQRGRLEHRAYRPPLPAQRLARKPRQVLAVHPDTAAARPLQQADAFRQRRFARPAGADHGGNRSGRHLQRNALQHLNPSPVRRAVSLVQSFNLYHRILT